MTLSPVCSGRMSTTQVRPSGLAWEFDVLLGVSVDVPDSGAYRMSL